MQLHMPTTGAGHGFDAEGARWLPELQASPDARVRLFCFPYAGGSASTFASWPARLQPWIEVRPIQLPGRWNRVGEAPLTRPDEIVAALGRALPPLLDRPFALFGHSMGALLAFETARYLRRQGLAPPLRLFVSGRRAPQLPGDKILAPDASEAEFLRCLADLNGTPREVLEDVELMKFLGPVIRADFEVCRGYTYAPDSPLCCPIIGFGGADDPEVAEGRLEAWRTHTSNWWESHIFAGDHFYLHSAAAPLLHTVVDYLHDV